MPFRIHPAISPLRSALYSRVDKRANAGKSDSVARRITAFRASPALMTISRLRDGRWVEANEAFLHWSGFTREEVLGRNSLQFDLWTDPEARARFWTDLRANGSVRDRECEIRTRRGALHTVLLSGDVIEIHGEPHALLVAVDITERKGAEAELLKALAREQELGQLKSNFVSMVSHEFRTPLGIIQSSDEILSDYLDRLDPTERRAHLQSIAKNTRRMAGLMEEVLVLGRFDAGKMDFQPAPLDLRAFCQRLVDEVLSATERQCPIEWWRTTRLGTRRRPTNGCCAPSSRTC
jgi:PAS domain S-box-containing protein